MSDIQNLIDRLENEIRNKATPEKDDASALKRLEEIAKTYEGEDRVVSTTELLLKLKNSPPEAIYKTGLTDLDKILGGGFRKKQLVVLSGVTKHGKTSFAIDLTIRLAENNPLWFPFEESAEEILQKFLDRGKEPPIFYVPERITKRTLEWIEHKIIEAKAKFDSKIVFIDHLGFVQDNESGHYDETMSLKIERIMRTLRSYAVRWNITIVLLAHLTKTRLDTNPTLEDLKGSSAIAQEADTVLLLWRRTKRGKDGRIEITNEANLSIQANRRTGKTGNIQLVFSEGRFLEKVWDESQQMEEDTNEIWTGLG